MWTAAPSSLAAKILLALAAAGGLAAMLGPFQEAEQALGLSDKAAHFLAFYGLTALLFVAFPHRRRFDLACLALLAGVGVEVAQGATGRNAAFSDLAANAAGVLAVLGPTYLEALRARGRPSSPAPVERRRAAWSGLKSGARAPAARLRAEPLP